MKTTLRRLVETIAEEVLTERSSAEQECDECHSPESECRCDAEGNVLKEFNSLDDLEPQSPDYDRIADYVYYSWPDRKIDTDWGKIVDLYVRRAAKNRNVKLDKDKLLDKVAAIAFDCEGV